MSNLFLDIEDKEDSAQQTEALAGVPSHFTYTAAEWNLMRDKIIELHTHLLEFINSTNGTTPAELVILANENFTLFKAFSKSHFEIKDDDGAAIIIHIAADGELDNEAAEPIIGSWFDLYQHDEIAPVFSVSVGVIVKKQEGDVLGFIGAGTGIRLIKIGDNEWRMVRLGVG